MKDQQELIERALANIEARTADTGPSESRVPVEHYTCPGRFERELALLRRLPMVAGHVSAVAEPRAFLCQSSLGVPRLLARDGAGELRAFINACRHRGTKLVWEDQGIASGSFKCPYHAWTYGLDGALKGTPAQDAFPSLTEGTRDLVPLSCAERGGLAWVLCDAADPSPMDLTSWLGGIDEDLKVLDLASHVPYRPRSRTWKTNWKVIVDGALEAYHIPRAHRRTIAPLFAGMTIVHDSFGPHARVVLPTKTITRLRDQPRESWRLRDHSNSVLYLFPTSVLLIQADHVVLLRLTPLAADETRIDETLLIPEPPATAKARRHWDRHYELTHRTLDEDFVIGERIQETLASGANSELLFGRNEMGLTQFHASLEHALAG